MSKILKIRAHQVFDSRGNPTVEAKVYSKNLNSSYTSTCQHPNSDDEDEDEDE